MEISVLNGRLKTMDSFTTIGCWDKGKHISKYYSITLDGYCFLDKNDCLRFYKDQKLNVKIGTISDEDRNEIEALLEDYVENIIGKLSCKILSGIHMIPADKEHEWIIDPSEKIDSKRYTKLRKRNCTFQFLSPVKIEFEDFHWNLFQKDWINIDDFVLYPYWSNQKNEDIQLELSF